LSYLPASNFNGSDSFTFRVNDGQLDSPAATVSITVQPVNDAPVAQSDTYSVQAGSSLVVNAPGVLSNDTDIDSGTLTALLVSPPAHGGLTLSGNGSLSYTPVVGYSGPDSFTYAATDGASSSSPASVAITVTAAPPTGHVLTADFDADAGGFAYADNRFRNTMQSAYASGTRLASGGYSGGALQVLLGGIDKKNVNGMSGGWSQTFTLGASATLQLTFKYSMNAGADYEAGDLSQVLASLDGGLKGVGAADYVAQLNGDGNGGSPITTGWRTVTLSLGTLSSGTHTLVLGGYNNKKDSVTEATTILIDDVSVAP
jgi:hypothetical protein